MARWTAADIGMLQGRRVVVTGGNSGVGLETLRMLLARGADTVMACRDVTKGETARRDLPSGPGSCRVVPLDLADLDSVAGFADRLPEDFASLDVLVNNAAIMGGNAGLSAQGYERQMATNQLGHFALTAMLWPRLRSTNAARVVTVSSIASRGGRLGPGMDRDLLVAPERYEPMAVYANTKQANLLFAQELGRRISAARLSQRSVACHPGVSASNLFPTQLRNSGHDGLAVVAERLMPLVVQSSAAGALATLRAVADPAVGNGDFVGPRGLGGSRGLPQVVPVFETGRDEATARRLWELCEELTGVTFSVA
ncbi:MAG: oxidoreductase [Actinomycetales bacterium]